MMGAPMMQNGTPMQGGMPMQNGMPMQGGGVPMQYSALANGMPMIQQIPAPVVQEKENHGLIKIILIIIFALIAVTFIGLFIWMLVERNEAQSDLDGKLAVARAEAKDEQAKDDYEKYQEEMKYPYRTFAGPVDYGQLTFQYPKTWSLYVASAATAGGDYEAYFNPVQVDAVGVDTINALRVSIVEKSFDVVTQEYQKKMDRKDSGLTMESTTIGPENKKITANKYTGKIPDTELTGYIVTFKIRDKTAILQTDSVLFAEDYNKLLETVTFNE